MGNRNILQMDQTTFAYQIIFRNKLECGENSNMDCRLRLCSRCHYAQKAKCRPFVIHNPTNIEYFAI
jgi:hypothetical protein